MDNRSSGQILLITLLVLTVAMTIALSVIGRSRTSVNTSTDVAESARAFSAAEAGIEEFLKTGAANGNAQTLAGAPASYTTSMQVISATGPYAFPNRTTRGDTETLWMVNHDPTDPTGVKLLEQKTYLGPSIDVCWKGPTPPAISVTILYKKAGAYLSAKAAFDSQGARGDNFTAAGALTAGCGQPGNTVYKQTITFTNFGVDQNAAVNPAIILALRIHPFFSDADIFVDSGANALPSQGSNISATGTTGTGITRKIQVAQEYRSPPSIFDNAVVSQSAFSP